MLTNIRIENFKGIEGPAEVPIRPVTLLFGANSAGKSSVLHAIHFIRSVLERYDLDPFSSPFAGESIDLGGFQNLLHKHQRGRRMILAFKLDLSSDDLPDFGLEDQLTISDKLQIAEIEFAFSLDDQTRQPVVDYYLVKLNDVDATLVVPDDTFIKNGNLRLAYINQLHPLLSSMADIEEESVDLSLRDLISFSEASLAMESLSSEEQETRNKDIGLRRRIAAAHPGLYSANLKGFQAGIPTWGKAVAITKDSRGDAETPYDLRVLSEIIVGPLEMLKNVLIDGRAVGPLRTIPPRAAVASRGVLEMDWYSGLAAWQRLHQVWDTQLLKTVNSWLNEESKLCTQYTVQSFEYREIERDLAESLVGEGIDEPDLAQAKIDVIESPVKIRLYLHDGVNKVSLSPHDVGVGLSQLIPVVVAAVDRSSSFVLIEQPELHVHPKIQVGLGDMFASQALDRQCTFLVETHSEALLLRIMKRLRQGSLGELPEGMEILSEKDISILLIQNVGMGVTVTPMDLTSNGEFYRPWPGGFFEETLKETF